jgi:outer membrane protein, heavy metal efflux system
MRRSSTAGAAFVAALLFTSSITSAQSSTLPLTLEAAVARALASNRELAVARLEGPVAQAAVEIAKERPNPDVTYEVEKETPKQSVGASFPIEIGGKRGRRIDLAEAGVGVQQAGLNRLTLDVRNRVRRAFFALVAANRRARLIEDLRGIAQRARDTAQARFDAGDVPRIEVLQTELALVETENGVAGARGDVRVATIDLNLLLAQPPDTPIDLVEPTLGALPSPEVARSLATGANVELALLDRRLAEQTARRGLAVALRTPDLTAGATYTFDAQPEFSHGYRASGGITVPLFTRHKAAVVLEDAAFARLTTERDAMIAAIASEVTAALARASAAREQVERSERESLPRAAEVDRMAQDAYSAGQTGLVALLQALQFTRDVRQRALDATVQYHEALADLERAIGAPLP